MKKKNIELALDYFRNNTGIHKAKELLKMGIHNRTLYSLLESNEVIRVGYGRYKLATTDIIENISYAEIGSRTKGVFCLISALSFHQIGTEFPLKHYINLPQGSYKSTIHNYSVNYTLQKKELFNIGIEEHIISGTKIKVYSVARTVVDCFKYRNKIGLDIAIEALRESLNDKKTTMKEILKIATILRMKNIIMPYLEVLI